MGGADHALDGVDNIRNAPNVKVGIYASADPIQLSPTREPVTFATYSPMQDARFRATTRGRIVNGVLTTEPVDVRFYKVTNSMYLERPLRHARLQATISPAGVLEGYRPATRRWRKSTITNTGLRRDRWPRQPFAPAFALRVCQWQRVRQQSYL